MNMPTRAFLQHYKLSISTLSPVHIGCGEDYEPTNYVMDDQCLHYFDVLGLADALSEDDRKKLDHVNKSKTPLLEIQKFFFECKETLIVQKKHTRIVSPDLFKKYSDVIGKAASVEQDGKKRINTLEIARTSYNSHTQMPIIPGSSLKGAIRTAFLNELNQARPTKLPPKELEKELLKGAFQTDPMRLIKISDASCNENRNSLVPRIVFENNVRRVPLQAGKPTRQLLSLMREVIPAFNFQSFSSDLTIQDLLGVKTDLTPNLRLSIEGICKACNSFYLEIFTREHTRFLERGCLQPIWAKQASTILELIKPFIAKNAGMMLRVGRHSGAESVTIDGVRNIKIMKGPGKPPSFEKKATTDWLAGEHEKSEVNLIPFGWIFIDFNFPELNTAREKLQFHFSEFNAQAITEQSKLFERVAIRLDALQKKQNTLKEIEAQKQRQKLQQEQAEQAKLATLAAMSPEQQAMQALRDRLDKNESKAAGAQCKLADDLRRVCEASSTWSQPLKDELHLFALELLAHLTVDSRKNAKWKARLAALKS